MIHCGRLDPHDDHQMRERLLYDWLAGWHVDGGGRCPGEVTIEGGSLERHDCGARVHPDTIHDCCSRCEGTVCRECGPCRRGVAS